MVLGALAALLEIEGDISVVAQSRDGAEALRAVLTHKPDVFITDIEMPKMTGLDVAAELKRRRTGTRVIILTTFARAGYLRRALEAGASGYLLKDMKAEELADAVRRVHQGLRCCGFYTRQSGNQADFKKSANRRSSGSKTGKFACFPYNQPRVRAIRAASTRLLAPSLLMASER